MPKKQVARWEVEARAGDVDLSSVGLAIPNPLRGQPLAVPPDIRLGDTPDGQPAILWSMLPIEHGRAQWGKGGTPAQAFWAFLELATEQRPDVFLKFAQRFGPLGLWPYRSADGQKWLGVDWVPSIPDGILTPFRYREEFYRAEYYRETYGDAYAQLRAMLAGECPFGPAHEKYGEYSQLKEAGLLGMLYEPIEEWRHWASHTRGVVDLAFALRDGCAPRRLWEAVGYEPLYKARWNGPGPAFGVNAEIQRSQLAYHVQHWFLKWSGMHPVIRWKSDRPTLMLGLGGESAVTMPRASVQVNWPENSLFPALVGQLIAVITASAPVAACSRCGRLHPRSRKPRTDQPAYCSDACRLEARRKSKRESNARARARLRERG